MTVGTSVGGNIFVHGPFTSVTRCCFVTAGAGDLEDGDGNSRDQRGVHGDLGNQRCSWRRVWEGGVLSVV